MSWGKTWDHLTAGPMRRRRAMHRRLAALDRLDARFGLGAPPPTTTTRSRRRRHFDRLTGVLVLVTTTALVVAVLVVHPQAGIRDIWTAYVATPERAAVAPHVPTTLGEDTYRFAQTQPGDPDTPVTYDPCDQIRFVVNDALQPPGAHEALLDAAAEISEASGLALRHVGTTTESPSSIDQRPLRDPDLYGEGWSPVLVAWTTPDVDADLGGEVAGVAGSHPVREVLGKLRYVTGIVHLDAPAFSRILDRPDGAAQARAIITHELAHVVGLDHVDDPSELMHADNVGQVRLGLGDRAGLARLGVGRCYAD